MSLWTTSPSTRYTPPSSPIATVPPTGCRMHRMHLRFMDAVVAVSEGQAAKVRKAGVPSKKLSIIRNAARLDAFRAPSTEYQNKLRHLAGAAGAEKVIVAAGRLSPEKGFSVLV